MKMNDEHKEFAVKCHAKYMKTTEVAEAFMGHFEEDLPPPPPPPDFENITTDEEYEKQRKEFVDRNLQKSRQLYQDEYGSDAEEKFHQDSPELARLLSDEYDQTLKQNFIENKRDNLSKQYNDAVELHYLKLRTELIYQLSRLNITNSRFPEKYRELFNKTREEFYKSHSNDELQEIEKIREELQTIYGYVKDLLFMQRSPKDVIIHVNAALSLLKTIASFNKSDSDTTNNA